MLCVSGLAPGSSARADCSSSLRPLHGSVFSSVFLDGVAVDLILVPKTNAIDVEIVAQFPPGTQVANNTIIVHQLRSGLCPLAVRNSLVATIVAASNLLHVRGLVANTAYRVTLFVDYVPANSTQQLRLREPVFAETTTLPDGKLRALIE